MVGLLLVEQAKTASAPSLVEGDVSSLPEGRRKADELAADAFEFRAVA
jgi:hypothetical protein